MTTPIVEFGSHVLFLLELVGLLWMFIGGDKLIRMVGYKGPLPKLYWTIQDNYILFLIALYLLAPQIMKTLMSKDESPREV